MDKLKIKIKINMNFKRQDDLPYPQPWEFIITNLLNNKINGTFVDVGAYDGNIVSNTFYLEDILGWNGICIEPNPKAFEDLKSNRRSVCLNIGISDIESVMDFYKINGYAEMLSGFTDYLSDEHKKRIEREINSHNDSVDIVSVETKRLDNILEENGIKHIDYLSIDTEGNEIRVLKSINFDKCYVNIISVENNDGGGIVRKFIEENGFTFITNVCGDDIYINKKNNQ